MDVLTAYRSLETTSVCKTTKMPGCTQCKKKSSVMFQCKECLNQALCTGCIQLERHMCPKLGEAKDKKLALLQKQLHFEKPRKVAMI